MNKIFLLGVGFSNVTKREVLEFVTSSLEKKREKYYIVTPNPELLVIAGKDERYKKVLNYARISLCDGVGVWWASRFLQKPIKERISGADFVENLCNEVANKPITVGFLGGGSKVAEMTAERLSEKYPGLKIGFVGEELKGNMGTFRNLPPTSARSSLSVLLSRTEPNELRAVGSPSSSATHSKLQSTDILFVAFGSPKQEYWIAENLEKLPVRVAIGVGGAFDFISGKVIRAPVWVQNVGLEWLYRLIRQPWRIRRQINLILFVLLVLQERLKKA